MLDNYIKYHIKFFFQAALMLTDWVLSNDTLFHNKKILELGSGVGFTGITIAKHCKIDTILLTDCHEDVLNAICDNIEINFPQNSCIKDSIKKEFIDGNKVLGLCGKILFTNIIYLIKTNEHVLSVSVTPYIQSQLS